MSILSTIGKVGNVAGNALLLPASINANLLGIDTTRGYSAANVAKTQLAKLGGSAPKNSGSGGTSYSVCVRP